MRISDWSSDVCSSDLIDRSEKCNGLRDVLRHAEPGQHAMLCQVLQGLLGRPGQGFLAQMDAWQNRVATDILLPVLRRDVFGKDVNATLRCGVGVRHQIAGYRSGRRYVDDGATAPSDKVRNGVFTRQEDALQIDVHGAIPQGRLQIGELDLVFLAEQAGVVDQNVDTTEFPNGEVHQIAKDRKSTSLNSSH